MKPSRQKIRAILIKAGFTPSKASKGRIKGLTEYSRGFLVTTIGAGIYVEPRLGIGRISDAEASIAADRYGEALRAAGFTTITDIRNRIKVEETIEESEPC
jgi:hypothetical protein